MEAKAMSGKKPLTIYPGSLVDLQASRNPDRATLEFDLEVLGRIAVVLTQAELHSLYQHILSEADAEHLAFELRKET